MLELGITIGIDIGGSTTKIVGIRDKKIITPMLVKATDPIASLFGAFGKFADFNSLKIQEIESILITGVGSSFVDKPIYGIKTAKVEEFVSIGLGGLYLSEISEAVIVSMGTGTALVHASKNKITHLGGTGIGGGTILGLSNRLLNIRDIKLLIKTAEEGSLSKVDLMVGDITKDRLPTLPPHTTASNFGKISDVATNGDIAIGIFNLVFQSIGMTAVFSVRNTNIKEVVLTGNLTNIPQCAEIFNSLREFYDIHFIIPAYSEYATAVGAALSFFEDTPKIYLKSSSDFI